MFRSLNWMEFKKPTPADIVDARGNAYQQFKPCRCTSPVVYGAIASDASLDDFRRTGDENIFGMASPLARRGATYAARQEFIRALRMITDSYDQRSGGNQYTQKLASGLRVLVESDDFIAIDSEQQMNMDFAFDPGKHINRWSSTHNWPIRLHRYRPCKTYYEFCQQGTRSGDGQIASGGRGIARDGKTDDHICQF